MKEVTLRRPRRSEPSKATCAASLCEMPSLRRGRRPHHVFSRYWTRPPRQRGGGETDPSTKLDRCMLKSQTVIDLGPARSRFRERRSEAHYAEFAALRDRGKAGPAILIDDIGEGN